MVLEELVDGGEVGLHACRGHRSPLTEPCDVAGGIHGENGKGGDGVEIAELEEL